MKEFEFTFLRGVYRVSSDDPSKILLLGYLKNFQDNFKDVVPSEPLGHFILGCVDCILGK